jgi:Flp pilus assembly protein CpaB
VGRVRPAPARSRVPRRLRLLLDPGALRYWATVLALAVVLALLVARSVGRAEAAAQRWGTTRTVLVATHEVAVGDRLAPSVRAARWPVALVPPSAVREVDRSARAAMAVGEGLPLTSDAIDDGASDPARRTVAVDRRSVLVAVQVGDAVDLWSSAAASGLADPGDGAERVAEGAEVRDVREESIVLAVDRSEVGAVLAAIGADALQVAGPG